MTETASQIDFGDLSRTSVDRAVVMRNAWRFWHQTHWGPRDFAKNLRYAWQVERDFIAKNIAERERLARERAEWLARDRHVYAHWTPEQRAARLAAIEEELQLACYRSVRVEQELREEQRLLKLHPVATGVVLEVAA